MDTLDELPQISPDRELESAASGHAPQAQNFDDALIGLIFPRTTARAYPAMIEIANRAMRHIETDDAGKHYHLVAFARTGAAARDAIVLLEYVRSLSGVQIYANGHPQRNAFKVAEVLDCYANAEGCIDASAWCQRVTEVPFMAQRSARQLSVPITAAPRHISQPLWLFPCRYLLEHGFSFQSLHPASAEAQIDADAFRAGCHWCPRFSAGSLSVLDH